jgi:hypothetical protein
MEPRTVIWVAIYVLVIPLMAAISYIWFKCTQAWYLNGKQPTNSPTRIWSNGTQEWRLNGRWHREDGPAIIWPNGDQGWWVNGELHRTDGPAIILANGYQAWFIKNQQLTQEEFELYRFRRWAVEGELE